MAPQMHVAYSSVFMGVGIVAGVPYYCARNNLTIGITDCMKTFQNIDIPTLADQTMKYAASGMIDPTHNLLHDRVYIFDGLNDTTVMPGVGVKTQEYYSKFIIDSSNIKTVFNIAAGHTFPTMNYGNPCTETKERWIGRCKYSAAYELLEHIYGSLQRPNESASLPGDFYEFSQAEFFYTSPPAVSSMDDVGYVYVPSGCKSGSNACKLHVAFHGCLQGRWHLGDMFARNTGYNEVGELNNIIIIYPQTIATNITNPYGCWDWWGYTGSYYATKNADQPTAVWRMVQKVAYFPAKQSVTKDFTFMEGSKSPTASAEL